jgi:formate dehydrogenase maturation protein FdhE
MSKAGVPRHDPIPIGDIAAPPFVRLPDPLTVFAARSLRFRTLAEGHQLGPYLLFLAAISECQHRIQKDLPEPDPPADDMRERAREHAIAAPLQVHFARLAARLDPAALVPIGDGVCPACGGAPVASAIVGWKGAHGTRFCTCSLCATQWHVVRIKCVLCESTAGIAYEELESGPDTVKAETCESCHGYLKILHQHKNPQLEAVADNVATLGLDLLLRENGYRRGAVNPFLLGY